MTAEVRQHAATLVEWLDEPITRASLKRARTAFDAVVTVLEREPSLRTELSVVLPHVFLRTGYLKDFKLLQRYARRVRQPELLHEVDHVVRESLPDIWILAALQRGDVDAAIDCWFEHEEHERARLCAPEIVRATPGRTDIVISGRMSVIQHLIRRGGRRRYRRACAVLQTLRGELARAGESSTFDLVVEDILARHSNRPALLDEMEKAVAMRSRLED